MVQGDENSIPQPGGEQPPASEAGDQHEDSSNMNEALAADEKPNIMFVGKENYTVTEDGETRTEVRKREPVDHINDGMTKIQLPSKEEQSSPFYHEQAGTIIALLPDLYKRYVAK